MSLAPRADEVETHLAPCWTFIMIDLYQMASLAGIFGSWQTDGEMLWCFFSAPLQPQQERGRTFKCGKGWRRSGRGERMGMREGRKALTLSLKVTAPQGGSRGKKRNEGKRWLEPCGKKNWITFCCHFSVFRSPLCAPLIFS